MNNGFRQFLSALWPRFWHPKAELKIYYTFKNYRRIWLIGIFLLAAASLAPLSIGTFIHHQIVKKAMELERIMRTERIASNAKRSVAYFLEERIHALEFTVREVDYQKLRDCDNLSGVLQNLKVGFGGITDLGLIDSGGIQVAYCGPFDLVGKDYRDQQWFTGCVKKGHYVSEVFRGYRNEPHVIIAVKSALPDGSFYILRATLDTGRLIRTVTSFKLGEHADIFLINRSGILQTPSKFYGNVLQKATVPIPAFSRFTSSQDTSDRQGHAIILGYAFIYTSFGETPFILMVIKNKVEMLRLLWTDLNRNVASFLMVSIAVVLVIVILTSTFMVNKIYESDSAKANTMLSVEQTSRLASIGRLAAGVAHEINNPLAVINEEAGYVKDLFSLEKANREDNELMEHVDSILESVDRCGTITRQLLRFSRQFDLKIQPLKLDGLISDVLSFHRKEAEYRNISLEVDVPEQIPPITTDPGKLQQIFLNLVNNAFQAIENGGRLNIRVSQDNPTEVVIAVADNGCGISEEGIKQIFEPFFTTKHDRGGTGLGLSITYGLVRKLQGKITVKSSLGKGTTFTVTLPVEIQEVSEDEGPTCG